MSCRLRFGRRRRREKNGDQFVDIAGQAGAVEADAGLGLAGAQQRVGGGEMLESCVVMPGLVLLAAQGEQNFDLFLRPQTRVSGVGQQRGSFGFRGLVPANCREVALRLTKAWLQGDGAFECGFGFWNFAQHRQSQPQVFPGLSPVGFRRREIALLMRVEPLRQQRGAIGGGGFGEAAAFLPVHGIRKHLSRRAGGLNWRHPGHAGTGCSRARRRE